MHYINSRFTYLLTYSWGPMEHCVRQGPDPHREGSRDLLLNFCDSLWAGGGPNENYAKVSHTGSRDLLLNFGTITYLGND